MSEATSSASHYDHHKHFMQHAQEILDLLKKEGVTPLHKGLLTSCIKFGEYAFADLHSKQLEKYKEDEEKIQIILNDLKACLDEVPEGPPTSEDFSIALRTVKAMRAKAKLDEIEPDLIAATNR